MFLTLKKAVGLTAEFFTALSNRYSQEDTGKSFDCFREVCQVI